MQNSNACLFIFVIMILQESCMKLRKGVYMTQQLHDNRITALYCRLSRGKMFSAQYFFAKYALWHILSTV